MISLLAAAAAISMKLVCLHVSFLDAATALSFKYILLYILFALDCRCQLVSQAYFPCSWLPLSPCFPNLFPFMLLLLAAALPPCLSSLFPFIISLLAVTAVLFFKAVYLHNFALGCRLSAKLVSLRDFAYAWKHRESANKARGHDLREALHRDRKYRLEHLHQIRIKHRPKQLQQIDIHHLVCRPCQRLGRSWEAARAANTLPPDCIELSDYHDQTGRFVQVDLPLRIQQPTACFIPWIFRTTPEWTSFCGSTTNTKHNVGESL